MEKHLQQYSKFHLFLFDLDDTLRKTLSCKTFPQHEKDQELLPNVKDTLKYLRMNPDNKIVGVTNQGGVSCKYTTEFQVWKAIVYFDSLIPLGLDNYYVSCYHEKNGKLNSRYVNRSKPRPHMLLEAINDYMLIEPSIFIGNQYTDRQAAQAANIHFVFAHNFFNWTPGQVEKREEGYFWRG